MLIRNYTRFELKSGLISRVKLENCLLWVFFVFAGVALSGCPALAQGGLTVLQTGSGQPLTSEQQVLQLGVVGAQEISFDCGFASAETPAPGTFLDSFTVTIQDMLSDSAVVATFDASGVVWAPSTPGDVTLLDNQIQRQAIIPPSLAPILGQGVAYSVQLAVPTAFSGSAVTVYFDLFDNLNQTQSLGWFNNVELITTPEPSAGSLLALGLALMAIKKLASRKV